MNSHMRNSALYAYRRGDTVSTIATNLGFPVTSIEKVCCPKSTCRITTAIVTVKKAGKPLIPIEEAKTTPMTQEQLKKKRQREAGFKSHITRRKNLGLPAEKIIKLPSVVVPLKPIVEPTQMDRIENMLTELLKRTK